MFRTFIFIGFMLPAGSASPGEPPKPDPKKPVDYVAWINQEFGSSVTNNASEQYAKAFEAYVETGMTKEAVDAALNGWSEKDLRLAAGVVKANERCLSLVAEAARISGCFFRLASPDGSLHKVELQNLVKVRAIAKLLAIRARLRLADGQTAEAMEDVTTLFQFARHLETQSTLIEYMVGLAVAHLPHAALRDAAAHLPQSTNFDSLLQSLRKVDAGPPPPTKMQAMERANYWDVLQRFLRDSDGDGRFDQLALAGFYEGPIEPIKLADAVKESDDYFTKVATLFSGNFATAKAKAKALDDERTDRKGELLSILAPSFTRAAELYRRALAERGATRIVLNCHAYRAKNKRWPADLSVATAGEPSEIRKDPYSDRDFIYRIEGDQPLLYSIGPNGKDDGGKRPQGKKDDADVVFWPPPKP